MRQTERFMQNEQAPFREETYKEHLTIINGIKFTPREIDVIACVLQVRREKWIASLFGVGERVIEAQTRNIRIKIGCNSREGVIDFIEKSHKFFFLRKYY